MTHKAGEYIGLSQGEWSSYCFNGLYQILKDCDLLDLSKEYYEQVPLLYDWEKEQMATNPNHVKCGASGSGFGLWLSQNGYARELDYDEIHCGHNWDMDVLEERLLARREIMAKEILSDEDLGQLYFHKD